ncbi:MAG: DUF433 domain-containing protein [Acholeplasma sp.]|jgi:uncharacterized protein (DUF433 family)|nr:DUF433 domain-containing protein [Acholeplasma sp.]
MIVTQTDISKATTLGWQNGDKFISVAKPVNREKIYNIPETVTEKNYGEYYKEYKLNYSHTDQIIEIFGRNQWGIKSSSGSIKEYFTKISKGYSKVSLNKSILSGMPCVKNTRVSVSTLLLHIADGLIIEEVAEDFNITVEDVKTALEYVASVLDGVYTND